MEVKIFIYWLIYAFFGWIIETIYTSVPQRKFQERGFLYGPIIPIYGFGALIIIYFLNPFFESLFLVFVLGIFLTSLLEYITSYIMEKIFHMRWWDYSKQKFNLNGRICLKNSFLFGVLSVILVELIHPNIVEWVSKFSDSFLLFSSVFLFVVVFIDFINSTIYSLNLSKMRLEIERISEEVSRSKEAIKNETRKSLEQIRASVSSLDHHILKAYPNLKHSMKERLEKVKELIESKRS